MDVMVKRSVAISARKKRSTRKKKGIIKDDKSCMNEARKIREGRKKAHTVQDESKGLSSAEICKRERRTGDRSAKDMNAREMSSSKVG